MRLPQLSSRVRGGVFVCVRLSLLLCAVGAVLGGLSTPLGARVGESQADLERRLLAAGGVVYRDQEMRNARMRGMPYQRILPHLPGNVEVRVYFKTADGRRAMASELAADRMPDGWELHVVYMNGRSVLEAYRRSRALNDQEVKALLALHRDGGHWERAEAAEESALGYRMQRSDEKLRANRHENNVLMIFDAQMDRHVQRAIEEDRERSAPVSVEGF